MPDLPKKKVGIVACSGEELPEGTVTRLAALKVLEPIGVRVGRPSRTLEEGGGDAGPGGPPGGPAFFSSYRCRIS